MTRPDASSEALAQLLQRYAEEPITLTVLTPRPRKFDPAKPLSPLAAKLLATSNAFGEAR